MYISYELEGLNLNYLEYNVLAPEGYLIFKKVLVCVYIWTFIS